MTFTCPHKMEDNFCNLRQKECEPCAEGCVLAEKYQLVRDQADFIELQEGEKKK